MEYAIEALGVSKHFGSLKANDNVTIQVEKGSVHAICGENGAGKSTLMNVLYGLYLPTGGSIKVNGRSVTFKTPKEAIDAGVGMVHQHFMLIDNLTVAENIVLGKETGTKLFFDRKLAIKQVEELAKKYNLNIDPRAKIADISVGMQQRVEILKALYRDCDILILDEPTAVLAPSEIRDLFESIRFLIKNNKTVIIITHKLDEVLEISNRISILRLGKLIDTVDSNSVDEISLTQMMVGRDVNLGGSARQDIADKSELLEVSGLHYKVGTHQHLDKLNLKVNSGEIVGIAGVDGNGQSQLIEILSGVIKHYSGSIKFSNHDLKHMSIRAIKELGLGYIPEDRHKDGLILDYSINQNMVLGIHYHQPYASKLGVIDFKAIQEFSDKSVEDYDIRIGHGDDLMNSLSGGNQQKVIIARELSTSPQFILASQPTRGLDVGAIEFVHNALVKARNNNQGILLISFELEEVLALSDRICVMSKGNVVGEFTKGNYDIDVIGKLMLGLKGDSDE